LCANGAAAGTAAGIRQAVFAYNHSQAYVNDVLGWAARYTIPVTAGLAVVMEEPFNLVGPMPYLDGILCQPSSAAAGLGVLSRQRTASR
jgi:hypothetical protein